MALSANLIWQKTGGSDSAGGGFDPSLVTATHCFTDLAGDSACNTSSPVVKSASYNFAATDVGHWLFIASGTNWLPGWYYIASVASNKATLQAYAAANHTPSTRGSQSYASDAGRFYLNPVAGCASTATPTGGVWSIDRSRIAGGAIFDSGTVGTAATTAFTHSTDALGYTSGPQDIGNILNLISGTGSGFVASMYAIINATSTIYTLDRSQGSAAATAISWSLGGSFATLGGLGAVMALTSVAVTGQTIFATGSEFMTSTTANVSGGQFNPASVSIYLEGFAVVCGDLMPGAYLSCGTSGSPLTSCTAIGSTLFHANIVVDGQSGSGNIGVKSSGSPSIDCIFLNFPSRGSQFGTSSWYYNCGQASVDLDSSVADTCSASGTNGAAWCMRSCFYNCVKPVLSPAFGACISQNSSYGTGGTDTVIAISTGVCENNVNYGASGFAYSGSGYTLARNNAYGSATSGPVNGTPLRNTLLLLSSNPWSGNHFGGGTDLVVDGSNNTWVTSSSSAFTANDVGLIFPIYGGTSWTPGLYKITGFDSGTSSAILNWSPAATGATGGSFRIADFRPNNTAGAGGALRGAGIGAIGQVDAIDIGAVQHQASGGTGGYRLVNGRA